MGGLSILCAFNLKKTIRTATGSRRRTAHRNQIAIVIFDNGREARTIMGGYFRRRILIV